MNGSVYLDNSATTKPSAAVLAAVTSALTENWGNPSSLYNMGLDAENVLNSAREKIAGMLGCGKDEIYFNSCGTEGDNTAIAGAALKGKKRGNKIVTTSLEHPAVLNAVKRLGDEGFDIVYLSPDSTGHISEQDIFDAIDEKTVLVSIMLVNNEIGSIFPVAAAARAIKQKNAPALLHTDAVQAFGKLDIDVNALGVDLLTISGHKIHAPKGVGALYIRKGVHIPAFIVGGGQEKGMRSGTENVPLIAGLGAAVGELPDLKRQYKVMKELSDYAKQQLTKDGLCVINSPDDALPYIVNFSLLGYRSETVLHFLESRGIFVSSGSACSKGKGSYVLAELGLDRKRIDSAIRISFCRDNTKEDIDALVVALQTAAKTLRKAYK